MADTTRRGFLVATGALALAAGAKGRAADASTAPAKGRFSVTVLNPDCMVGGAGLCVVVRTPAGKCYLFDTGNGDFRGEKRKNNGRDLVAPWLRAHGISEIDGLVISHYHADHFGGFLWLFDHFPIRKVFDNSFVPSDGKPLGYHYQAELDACRAALSDWERAHPGMLVSNTRVGTELGWDEPGVRFEVAWPPRDWYCEAIRDFRKSSATDFPFHHLLNANSTTIRAQVGKRTFFIGGDSGSEQYCDKYVVPYMKEHGTWGGDVCVLPGHGSPDNARNIALMSPKPQVAVGSLGNLPWMLEEGRRSLKTHLAQGIRKTYNTNIHGDVTVSTDGDDLRVACDCEKLYAWDPK